MLIGGEGEGDIWALGSKPLPLFILFFNSNIIVVILSWHTAALGGCCDLWHGVVPHVGARRLQACCSASVLGSGCSAAPSLGHIPAGELGGELWHCCTAPLRNGRISGWQFPIGLHGRAQRWQPKRGRFGVKCGTRDTQSGTAALCVGPRGRKELPGGGGQRLELPAVVLVLPMGRLLVTSLCVTQRCRTLSTTSLCLVPSTAFSCGGFWLWKGRRSHVMSHILGSASPERSRVEFIVLPGEGGGSSQAGCVAPSPSQPSHRSGRRRAHKGCVV